MNITRTVTQVVLEIPKVESVTEAEHVMKEVLAGRVTNKADRDAANGLNEAFFVTYLREIPKTNGALTNALKDLQATFGKYEPFRRAALRVKKWRGKNKAWSQVAI